MFFLCTLDVGGWWHVVERLKAIGWLSTSQDVSEKGKKKESRQKRKEMSG